MPCHKIEINMTPEEYLEMKIGEDKLTDAQIAEMFCVSSRTLFRWKRENGIKENRKISDYTELKREGLRDYEIANRWGIDRVNLYAWKKRRGII